MTKLEYLKEVMEQLGYAMGESDQNLEADIAESVGIKVNRESFTRYTQSWAPIIYDWMGCPKHPLPRFTSSIDDAIALVNYVLPNVMWKIGSGRNGSKFCLPWCSFDGRYGFFEASANTVPIAILKTLFAALISQEETKLPMNA